MFEAELAIGVMADQRQIFRQERDGLYESRSVAFWALDSIVHMYPIAAGLTERVSAEYEQPWYVELLIELFLAVRAQHLTTNNRIISRGSISQGTQLDAVELLHGLGYLCTQQGELLEVVVDGECSAVFEFEQQEDHGLHYVFFGDVGDGELHAVLHATNLERVAGFLGLE